MMTTTTNQRTNEPPNYPTVNGYRYLVLIAALMTYGLITMGGIVRVTGSGLGCPDWPTCHGQLIPPMQTDAIIEYLHRLIAALTSPFIIASAIVGWWKFRPIKWVSRPPLFAVGFLVVEIVLGAITVLTELPPEVVAIHLGTALTVFALMLVATVVAFVRHNNPTLPDRLSFRSPFARLTLWTLAATFIVLVSGAFVAGSGSTAGCIGWPLCNGRLFPTDLHGWIHMTHRFIVGAASTLVVVVLVQAWRTQRTQTAILPAATVMGVLSFAQALVGALKTTMGFPPFLLALHVATAAAVWAAVVVLVVLTGLAARTAEEERAEAQVKVDLAQRAKDLLATTRPVVVALLLVTAYTGMVVGKRAFPPLDLTFWTLLGGALAAGGAQAINQYVDRDIDKVMQRTASRPLPSGRMTPAEGLAWGLALCVASLYIVAGFVNWLAALLVLAGILYYVVWYTLILKRTSAQNIVIGGGAGALPPMVGWAAATGHLAIPALFLFAIIFFWTPPHFWALAIVRLKDYARAGVPMLPVVRGEEYTRNHIMLYTVMLVVITLLLPILGMAGAVYLAFSVLLGGWLLYAAWQVWKGSGNKVAWSMYRTSSMYLAFLMLALMADALIKLPRLP
jgi:protoheme IX farnesyltransferase